MSRRDEISTAWDRLAVARGEITEVLDDLCALAFNEAYEDNLFQARYDLENVDRYLGDVLNELNAELNPEEHV